MSYRKAYFRFEASPTVGAGHAIRSCVIADFLIGIGWDCQIITSRESYDFIPLLSRFARVDPEAFENEPKHSELLVIDYYGADKEYESHFRKFSEKILVIDDLANRPHECDVLIDSSFQCPRSKYQGLVPINCLCLTGTEYALLRPEFTRLRQKALEKRMVTKKIKRILVSFGGGYANDYILKALDTVHAIDFKEVEVDIVLGFRSADIRNIEKFVSKMTIKCNFHQDPDMPKLVYDADLAIGSAGGSLWERFCLGLPSFVWKTADNQEAIYTAVSSAGLTVSLADLSKGTLDQHQYRAAAQVVDGHGLSRLLTSLKLVGLSI